MTSMLMKEGRLWMEMSGEELKSSTPSLPNPTCKPGSTKNERNERLDEHIIKDCDGRDSEGVSRPCRVLLMMDEKLNLGWK